MDGDRPDARTVTGLGNRKNELVLEVLRVSGVQVYAGAVALVQALRALGSPVAVVSASENTDAALEAAGVDHRDHADELRAHGADVVVTDLAELLNPDATSG